MLNRHCGALVLTFLGITASHAVVAPARAASDDWQRIGLRKGIELSERPVHGSRFPEYRAQGELCGNTADLVAYIRDVERYPDWLPSTEAVEIIEQTPERQIYYIRTATPWPFASRDMVYELVTRPSSQDRAIIDIRGLPERLPARPPAVRMTSARGNWQLVFGQDRTDLTFAMHIDPGDVPVIFAKRRVRSAVRDTVGNLRAHFPCTGSRK